LKLAVFIFVFGTTIIAIALIFALFSFKKQIPFYYKYIFLFIILGLLMSTNTAVNNYQIWYFNKKISILLEQLIFMFQSLMLGLFFIDILNKSTFVKQIKRLLILSLLIQITILIIVLSTNTDIRPTIPSYIFLLICCVYYLRDLMNNKPTLILVRSSAFWIVMGIFYSSSIGFPVNSLISFIPKTQEVSNLRLQIFAVLNMSVIILYLFIIKSYLCLKHPQSS
jgi:hypothetical protein